VLVKRDVVPLANFENIKVVKRAQCVKLVQCRRDVRVFDIRQAADMNDEFRTPVLACEFVAGLFDISVRESKTLAHLSEA
jgi:peroxiredoxin family protein